MSRKLPILPPRAVEMDSATPKPNPNTNQRRVYQIAGISVEFPYKPYGSQLAFMSRVISTLDRAQRQGHCHALLESPTGTGKSLSLLCSALAWQQNHQSKNVFANLTHSKSAAPQALSDPLVSGGGFVPQSQPETEAQPSVSRNSEANQSAKDSRSQRKKATPTIFYASRTHSQITQVIREYRKTSYRVSMAVLASRKHYCTNKHLCGKENIDEECKLLLKDRAAGCTEFRNVHKVKGHPFVQKGGCHEAHDIEDLVKVGRNVKGCSYFAAISMAEEAQLIFCPYSYIINPTIRRAMELDLRGSVVILDEAHNIEDIARDAGSVDVEEDVLYTLQTELGQLCLVDPTIYQPLYDMIQGIISWIGQRKSTLEKREFQNYFSCWTGDKALRELEEVGISQQFFPILQECATKAIKVASDAESGSAHLSGMSVIALEGLFSSFGYFFSGNGLHALDYQLALRRYVKRDAGHTSGSWTLTLSLWCLNPAVVFREIANLSMSIILSSGTLSPMSSFSSELGVQFETCMEAPHVIDVESQLWAAIMSTGPGNYPLNASYKTADGYAFQDELGASLEEICKIVPGGALVFFPSYKLMEKLCNRWRETGQWSRLNAQKSVFTEPRGNQDDFETVLKSYYDSIHLGNRPVTWKIKRGKKKNLNQCDARETQQYSFKGGAAFLAVCRGKVSEGIDFSDDNARVVVIVGIPFPNINDIQVAQKKKFNDMYKSSKNLLSGNEWYCHQAFRALNQAIGRCIRHRFDYGAIILIDERFREERNIAYISKWLRKSIKHYNFDLLLVGLRSFFQDVKERTVQNGIDVLENLDIKEESISYIKPKMLRKGDGKSKNQNCNNIDHHNGGELVSKNILATEKAGQLSKSLVRMVDETRSELNSHDNVKALAFAHTDEKDMINSKEYIDSEVSPQKHSRCSETTFLASSSDSPDQFVVKETPAMIDCFTTTSSAVLSKDNNSNSNAFQGSNELSDQLSCHSTTIAKSNGVLYNGMCTSAVTPKRTKAADICDSKPEMESSLDKSVNSHTQKKRKPMSCSSINCSQVGLFGNPNVNSNSKIECTSRMSASRDINRKIDFSFEADCTECERKKLNVLQTLMVNNCSASGLSSHAVMDKRLHICCSLCRNSLGLPENQFFVMCSLTSSSKAYLASILRSGSENLSINGSKVVPVVMSEISSVDQRLYNVGEGAAKNGIWCEEDGCVFRTIVCPFCTVPGTFLGLQIIAADALNIHLLNKILFYFERLQIKNLEAFKCELLSVFGGSDHDEQAVNGSDLGQVSSDSDLNQGVVLAPINKFSCLPKKQNSGGWRTTKSKLRLPKRALLSVTEDECGSQ